MNDNFNLLKNKKIIEILDGDSIIEENESYRVQMPYLSGPELCNLSNQFGLERTYGKESRWVYLNDLLDYLISQNRCDELLIYMFRIDNFKHLLRLQNTEEIKTAHSYIVKRVIEKINVILLPSRHELQYIHGHFYITESGKEPMIEDKNLKLINSEYINGLKDRCAEELLAGNFDSVITKSRTLVEEVLIYILEQNQIEIESKGDLNKIYNQVKKVYNMHQDKGYNGSVNGLLSGLEKIVQSIAEMRNANSDAHGVGTKRINIREYEARLIINSTITFCDYILEIYKSHI